jgi:hypothetical protein
MKTTKYKVKYLSQDKMGGYAGMNDQSAGVFHFPMHNHDILVNRTLHGSSREQTIKHEMVEEELMKNKHYPYWKAHEIALHSEKLSFAQLKKKFGIERVR